VREARIILKSAGQERKFYTPADFCSVLQYTVGEHSRLGVPKASGCPGSIIPRTANQAEAISGGEP